MTFQDGKPCDALIRVMITLQNANLLFTLILISHLSIHVQDLVPQPIAVQDADRPATFSSIGVEPQGPGLLTRHCKGMLDETRVRGIRR